MVVVGVGARCIVVLTRFAGSGESSSDRIEMAAMARFFAGLGSIQMMSLSELPRVPSRRLTLDVLDSGPGVPRFRRAKDIPAFPVPLSYVKQSVCEAEGRGHICSALRYRIAHVV